MSGWPWAFNAPPAPLVDEFVVAPDVPAEARAALAEHFPVREHPWVEAGHAFGKATEITRAIAATRALKKIEGWIATFQQEARTL